MEKIIVDDRAIAREIHFVRLSLAVYGEFQIADRFSDLQVNDIAVRSKLVKCNLELRIQLHMASEIKHLSSNGNLSMS